MRKLARFHWLCIQEAWRGCWTRANEAAGLLGGGILWIVLLLLKPQFEQHHWIEAPTTIWGVAGFTVALAAGSVALAFCVIYLGRLITAPSRLYWAVKEKNERLEDQLKPRFKLSFDDECLDYVPNESAPRKTRQWQSINCPAWYVLLRLTSDSDAPIHGCTAHFVRLDFKEKFNEPYQRLSYSRSEPLSLGGFDPFELRPRLIEHINVCAIDQIDQRIRMQWKQQLQVYEHLFDKPGFYKLTIRVATDNAGCDQKDLEIDWRGVFERPRVRLV
jgi:hypothetical protein